MALGEVVVQHELPLVGVQLQEPQLVGEGGLRHAQTFGSLGLGAVPQHHHILHALCLFKGVQVGSLDVFQQAQRRGLLVAVVAEDGRDGGHLCQPAGTEPPLPCHQLIAAIRQLPHRDRLQQTVLPDALRQCRKLLLAEFPPCLKWRRPDLVDGQEIDLARLLFAFKHECTPPLQFCRVCFPHFPGKAWKISGFSHSVPHKERPCQTNRSAGSFRIRSLLRYFSGLFAILPPFLG